MTKFSVPLVILTATSLAACVGGSEHAPRVHAGDDERGAHLLARYECGVCHAIPGIAGAVGRVGPPLDAYARRPYVAGKFPNTPEMLVRFIVNPPAFAPRTAMPAVPMTDQDARDMAAYLFEQT